MAAFLPLGFLYTMCGDLTCPDRIEIAFDDHRLVANAGLILPVTLAHRLGLSEFVDRHVDLGEAPGRANGGDKLLTLVASALAGGPPMADIDDADALRAGGTEQVLGCAAMVPSTLGTFLGSFQWGYVRQLDRVSREVMARAWSEEAGPGEEPLTIDLDSIRHRRTRPTDRGRRAHSATITPASGAITRSSPSPPERVRLWRTDGSAAQGPSQSASGGRADSGFYTHPIVVACRKTKVRFSITIRQHPSVRNMIEAIPEVDWTLILYWMEGAADVAETSYAPFASEPDAAPVRLIVRRVTSTPGSQLALLDKYSYHAFITDREGNTLDLEVDHRRHAEIKTPSAISSTAWASIRLWRTIGPLPRQRHLAGGAEPAPYLIRGHRP